MSIYLARANTVPPEQFKEALYKLNNLGYGVYYHTQGAKYDPSLLDKSDVVFIFIPTGVTANSQVGIGINKEYESALKQGKKVYILYRLLYTEDYFIYNINRIVKFSHATMKRYGEILFSSKLGSIKDGLAKIYSTLPTKQAPIESSNSKEYQFNRRALLIKI